MIQHENNRVQMTKMRMLREYHIKVLDNWLSECVSFCVQENPTISNEGVFQFAFSQWLLADLKEIGTGVLPPGLAQKGEQHTMSGSFPVQMQYLMDISEPAYDQWRALYDKKLDEADDEVQMRKSQAPNVKKRRMLKLELTDGKQTVVAMEHSPIRCLNTKLTPGLKLLLTGPLRCINQVIFLEPRNVRVLGGEVDVLLITNAYENVLLRALNKPANPTPKLDYEEPDVSEARHRANYSAIQPIPMDRKAGGSSSHHQGPNQRAHQRKSPAIVEDDVDDSLLMGIDLDMIESTQPKPEQVPTVSTLMDDDDMDAFAVQLVDVPREPEIMHHQVSSTKQSQSSPVARKVAPAPLRRPEPSYEGLIEDDIDVMNALEDQIQSELRGFDQLDEQYDEVAPPRAKKSRPSDEYRQEQREMETLPQPAASSKSKSSEPAPTTSKKFNQFTTSDLFEDSMDGMDALELNERSTTLSIVSPSYPHRIDGTSLATIDQLMALPEEQRRSGAAFVVYCEVEAVTEQPRIRREQWNLSVELTDQSAVRLPVRLHDRVISRMTRHDAAELMRLRKTDRDGVMKLLARILSELKELLQDIKCFWRVVYEPESDSALSGGQPLQPVVMETYEMSEERGAILLEKIIKENCSQLRKML
ncbi:recQ-mediated genome instability protein 1 [Anopheles gambiae]|uniref:recQ-mediated genome instability protein 1 n=1 Tax=Anopheles gambiae TaxID=7165 RepID=UPI002AC9D272|nr:recQ-mediated genome instability protein 1 [Anopheles gambiae]